MERKIEAALRAAVDFLESHGYGYALIGGLALAQWGVVRATFDVDFKVAVPNQAFAAVRAALRQAFPKETRQGAPPNPFIVAVDVDDVIVDFLLALPGYDELVIERALRRDMGGWEAWVCSAEDLVVQKVIAGRAKDWMDVEMLLAELSGSLDQAYIEDWIRQFGEALDKPDLLPEYLRLLAKARRK